MNKNRFRFHEHPICPECGRVLDDAPARDFIVFLPSGQPSLDPTEDQCGWCDAMLEFQFQAPDWVTVDISEEM